MAKALNLAGLKFGRLTAVEPITQKYGYRRWRCNCACGNVSQVTTNNLTSGKNVSCGCLRRERFKAFATHHGVSHLPEYGNWKAMMDRCYREGNVAFARYGGRGIKVCERWHNVHNFLADMGRRPFHQATVERLDNDGNYEPGNCRWATMREQGGNRRTSRFLTHKGKTQIISDWAREYGLRPGVLDRRLNAYGWPTEVALTTPVQTWRGRRSASNR